MHLESQTAPVSKVRLWTGRVLSILGALFLANDAVLKFVKPDFVLEGSKDFGYAESTLVPLGIVLLVSAVLYLVPRTAVLGAILLTGYLGGAVATHVQHGDNLFKVVFPAIFGALLWIGLVLQDRRLSSLLPLRT
jgi:DoxX-like family